MSPEYQKRLGSLTPDEMGKLAKELGASARKTSEALNYQVFSQAFGYLHHPDTPACGTFVTPNPGDDEVEALKFYLKEPVGTLDPDLVCAQAEVDQIHHKRLAALNATDEPLAPLSTTDAIAQIINQVAELFNKKSEVYASEADPLANVHGALPVSLGSISSVQYALMMCSKQDTAVWLEINRAKAEGREPNLFEEWLFDSITWRVIGLALLRGF